MTDRRTAWSLTRSDIGWVGWRLKCPEPGSIASWCLAALLNQRDPPVSRSSPFLADSDRGRTPIASQRLGRCANSPFRGSYYLRYLAPQLLCRCDIAFCQCDISYSTAQSDSQGPKGFSLGGITRLTSNRVLNNLTQTSWFNTLTLLYLTYWLSILEALNRETITVWNKHWWTHRQTLVTFKLAFNFL